MLPMTTVSAQFVEVAIVASALGFPGTAWSAPPQQCAAFLSIPLSQIESQITAASRGCHKRALPTIPPRGCSVSEATDLRTRPSMVTGQSGRRTRASFVADDDRTAATGTDELVWDTHAVTTSSASELVWPKSDSPARSQEVLPAPVETQLVDADTTTITAATTAATVTAATVAAALAAVTVAIVLGQPLDAAAATTTTTNVELLAAQASASTDIGAILTKAGKASFGGGASGAAAAVVQVLSLMWLRTTMNFQVSLPWHS